MIKYKAKDDFIHRKVVNEDVLISVGNNIANFNGYMRLNETAAFIWKQLSTPKSIEELTDAMEHEFDVTYEDALRDISEFIQLLKSKEMVICYG